MVQRSLTQVIRQIEDDLQEVRDEFLRNIAEDLVSSTLNTGTKPAVDTGAYITSHSITSTSGAGRSRTSRNKPRNQNPQTMAAISMDQLMDDIQSLPDDARLFYIANRSPHAEYVESGTSKFEGRFIYNRVRSRANLHLTTAVNAVKARR